MTEEKMKYLLPETLEAFTPLKNLPEVSRLSQGRVLLECLSKAASSVSQKKLTMLIRSLSLPEHGRVLEIGPGCCQYAMELCLRGFSY